MLLKRRYEPKALSQYRAKRDAGEDTAAPPPAVAVEVLRVGRKQKFSPDLIARGAAEGWLAMAEGRITMKTTDGPMAFRIVRTPGSYCCHCGERIEDAGRWVPGQEKKLTRGMQHVAEKHASKASPDPENPAGYMTTNAFKGVREG